MKKKKLVLSRKLNLKKDTVMPFSNAQMTQVAGGGDTIFQCQSNGCSRVDTLCMVDMPTFNPGAGDCIRPMTYTQSTCVVVEPGPKMR